MKRICINPKCGLIVDEEDCLDYKHRTGARLCPECHEVTEEYDDSAPPNKCKRCSQGNIPIAEHFITHDMAMDAGDMSLMGQSIGIEWGMCPCCEGNYENCPNCKEGDEHAPE